MSVAAGILALLTGLAYSGLGVIAVYELGRNHKTRGFSYLGGAFALMAATCGPHHLVHAEHHLLWSEAASGPMLGALAIGFVPGGIFVLLRIEAAFGGRGDRFITGTPVVLAALPWVVVAACGAIVWEALGDARQVSAARDGREPAAVRQLRDRGRARAPHPARAPARARRLVGVRTRAGRRVRDLRRQPPRRGPLDARRLAHAAVRRPRRAVLDLLPLGGPEPPPQLPARLEPPAAGGPRLTAEPPLSPWAT